MGTKATSLLVKYWMGHSLGVESSYFAPSVEEQRKAYLEAYEKIDIFKTEINELERQKQQAIMILSAILPREKLEQIKPIIGNAEDTEEVTKIIERYSPVREELDRIGRAKGYATEEEDCQKIITEQQLPEYLKKHWHVVCTLPSGKILISNE